MNITDLTPDAKYKLATTLSGDDLIKLCATDSKMRTICQSSRYNHIWNKRLKDDYNVDYEGINPYMEYLLSTYLYKNRYWVVDIYDNNEGYSDDYMFDSRNKAINYIVSFISKHKFNVGIITMLMLLNTERAIENDNYRIRLEEVTFDHSPNDDAVHIFQEDMKALASSIHPDNKLKQEEFINDFNELMEGYDSFEDLLETSEFVTFLDKNVTNKMSSDSIVDNLKNINEPLN